MLLLILATVVLFYTTIAYDTFTIYIVNKQKDNWEGLVPYNNKQDTATVGYNYNTNKLVKVEKPPVIIRLVPPRAVFFGRFNGVEEITTGNYEEKYLDNYEFVSWKYQKERKEAVEAGILNEKE